MIKRRKFIKTSGIGLSGLILTPAIFNHTSGENMEQIKDYQVLKPKDNGEALINPGMGWTMHFYSNIIENYGSKLKPSDTLDDFPGLSTVYLRIPWSFVEAEEGKFNWEILDTPAQRWINVKKKVAIRITASESWMRWATPEWVAEAGVKGYFWGEKNEYWEPDFKNPIFLSKVDNFVKAMASRYDGNPNIAFIDIGHFGLWGEGHTVISSKIDYDLEAKKAYIDIYCKHFKNTLLCVSDDFAGHDKPGKHFPIMDYAFSKGVTMRDDSILVQPPPNSWYHADMAQQFWPSMPVILEHEHYGASKMRNAWSQELLLKSVEDYHASYMSIHWWPRILLSENRKIINQINLRIGYRLQLKKLEWPKKIKIGQPFTIYSEWANVGVAPCYKEGFPCFTLKDDNEGIISVLTDTNLDIRDLLVAERGKESKKSETSNFTIAPAFIDPVKTFYRGISSGKYHLYISVGMEDGTPVFELPYYDNDGHNRYKVGVIEFEDR